MNILNTRLKKLLAIVAFAGLSGGANADPIGPTCPNGSCWGGIYQLVYQPVAGSSTHYLFGIVMDLSNNTLPPGTTIENVAFKVTSSTSNILSALFVGTNAAGTWGPTPLIIGGLNSNGCDAGAEAFICLAHTGAPAQPVDTPTLLGFVFDVTLKPGETWLTTASLKIDFSGRGHLLSEEITAQPGIPVVDPRCIPVESCGEVPEPGTLALIALGLFVVGLARRRNVV